MLPALPRTTTSRSTSTTPSTASRWACQTGTAMTQRYTALNMHAVCCLILSYQLSQRKGKKAIHIVFKALLGFDLMSTGNQGYPCAHNAFQNHMKVFSNHSYNVQPLIHSEFFYSLKWASRHDSNIGGEACDWLGTCSAKWRPDFCQFKLWQKIFLRVK